MNTDVQRYLPFRVSHRCQDDQNTARPTSEWQDFATTDTNSDEQVIEHLEMKISTAAYELHYHPVLPKHDQ